jgi:hypothetical protein
VEQLTEARARLAASSVAPAGLVLGDKAGGCSAFFTKA